MTDFNGEILVVGDGGWGTALACLVAANGRSAVIWSYDPDYAALMQRSRSNPKFLPGVELPPAVAVTSDPGRAFARAALVVFAVPTKYARSVLDRLAPAYNGAPVLSASKGIEPDSLLTNSALVRERWSPPAIAVVSGPSHAEEVARGKPTTVVVAGPDTGFIAAVQRLLSNDRFRAYTNPDTVGVEIAGALKNVIAIAAGISDGMDLGDNAKSALITRGLAEMRRLGVAMGAIPDTFAGLAGMGDLITTCISPFGRNRRVGLELGRGRKLSDILASMEMVAEGITTTRAAVRLAERHRVEMPICYEVHRVLFEDKPPRRALLDLMTRSLKSELEDAGGER